MSILDGMDKEVEALRKHARKLQEKRDQLHTRIDLLKTDFLAPEIDNMDQDEMKYYLKRIHDRLQTIDVNVETIRDDLQVDSIHTINNLIDEIIKFGDPIEKRNKCQQYLNSCSSNEFQFQEEGAIVMTDKRFESYLLSCSLDDQKLIRKRLEALMTYLMKKMVSE
jgi:BCL2-associated athanogene 2